MDPAAQIESPDNLDRKPSFRKSAHDAANRKYRRRTPVGGSESSSSGGSPKRRSRSPIYSDDRQRKDNKREFERNNDGNRSNRSDSLKYSDRQSRGTSHDYEKKSDNSRHQKHAEEEDRGHHKPSRSGRDLRIGTNSNYSRHDSSIDRSRELRRSGEKYSRDKFESTGHRSKDMDYRYNDKEPDRAGECRDERKDRRRSPDGHRNDRRPSREEPRVHVKGSTLGRDDDLRKEINMLNEKRKHDDRESDRRKEKYHSDRASDKRKENYYNDRESDRHKEKYHREAKAEVEKEEPIYRAKGRKSETVKEFQEQNTSLKKLKHYDSEEERATSSKESKQFKSTSDKFTSEPVGAANQSETSQDLNSAKVAAMKAAELVNRNLVGTSFMSADQKKKLLWGNKKNTSTEEQSSNRWDLQLFADRERQEKFNKLMGVKGDGVPERKPNEMDAEQKQKLEMDLEKQYTAGLRRRDGRTVGLGL